jgi:hypothetical protein
VEIWNLVKSSDLESGLAADGPGVGFAAPRHQLEERRFASAIAANESDPFSRIDLKGNVPQQRAGSESFRNFVESNEHRGS